MLYSLKSSQRIFIRATQGRAVLQRRAFLAPTSALRADLVQDLYIKELRSYKPPAMKSSDAEGHVQKFMLPKAPLSPEEHDIASELKAYEDQKVDVEGQAAEDEEVAERDWFEEDEAEDKEHEAH